MTAPSGTGDPVFEGVWVCCATSGEGMTENRESRRENFGERIRKALFGETPKRAG